ncbi:MAG TPA: hypothetical protein VEX41_01265 [Candidatus Eisenbacteria bacterium]|nr:hypothetical protein [Candidatus Eisenbacteria bacterium]
MALFGGGIEAARLMVGVGVAGADKAEKDMDLLGGNVDKAGGKFAAAAVPMLAFGAVAAGALVAVGAEAIKLGPKYEAMDAKAQTIFGGSLGGVQAWADANASAMGLTGREATGLAANMGDLLVPMGFTRDQAAAMSTETIGLAGALSEWSGGTTSAAGASEILQKAMLGERDGLKSLGISISEADVQAQLALNGTDKLTGAALEQAKALATQQLIFAKSTDAQASYAAGTAEGIRSQHEMDAALATVQETLVEAVYPILKEVTGWLAENLPGAIDTVKGVIAALRPVFETVFGVVSTVIGVLVNEVFPRAGSAIATLSAAFSTIATTVSGVFSRVVGTISSVVDTVGRLFGTIVGTISSVVDTVGRLFGGMATAIGQAWGTAVGLVKGAVNLIIKGINVLIGAWNSISFTVPRLDLGPLGSFGGFTISLPRIGTIPLLEQGAWEIPNTMAAILHPGEMVVPRPFAEMLRGGAGGRGGTAVTIVNNFNGPIYGTEQTAKRLSDTIARQVRLAIIPGS